MKNRNSFKSVYRAIEFESERQIELLEKGEKVVQETRKWDDDAGISYAMRKKETSQDYRYFPDPDLLAVRIKRNEVENIKRTLPLMPDELKEKYVSEFGLTDYDAEIITKEKILINFFEETIKLHSNPKNVANWLITEILSKIKDEDQPNIKISPENLAKILNFIAEGKITRTVAKEIFAKVWEKDEDIDTLVKTMGGGISDDELENLILRIISSNPKAVEDFKASPTPEKQLKWFVGQVMKETRGKANAVKAEEKIKSQLTS